VALRPCQGCPTLVRDMPRCLSCHKKMMAASWKKQDEGRGNTTQRGLGWQHQQWAKQILVRDSYLCAYCGGKANTADHIKPRKTHPHLALDPDNGVACCSVCQNQKGDQQR
jgi:5-methylcytosine-specific restriction endonuclease McrA